MARVLKEPEHRAKRAEILDHAAGLIHTKGYAAMTIQDLLDGLTISRGALYHYFASKESLLEAMVDRMSSDAVDALTPIVRDPDLSAVQKFARYFKASAAVKTEQRDLIGVLLGSWYRDENVLLRQKMTSRALTCTAPLIIEPMIRQGVAEGVFTTAYPQQAGVIVVGVWLTLADSLTTLLFSGEPVAHITAQSRTLLAAGTDSIERILGAAAGSLTIDDEIAFDELAVALLSSARQDGREGDLQ
jgi:AcrR family transcriptional regulator